MRNNSSGLQDEWNFRALDTNFRDLKDQLNHKFKCQRIWTPNTVLNE